MTKEELEALGLTEEQIKDVFKINGKDIEKVKGDLKGKEETIETLQGQLDTANKEIEDFKELDVDEIKKRADDYKTKYETAETEAKEELESLKFEHQLEGAIRDSKAKNVKAVKALLDVDSLKESKNQIEDIKAALESTKADNDYLFGEIDPEGTGGSLGAGERKKIDSDKTSSTGFIDAIREVQAKRN